MTGLAGWPWLLGTSIAVAILLWVNNRIEKSLEGHVGVVRVPQTDDEYYIFCHDCGKLLGDRSGPWRYTHGPRLVEDVRWHRQVHEWELV